MRRGDTINSQTGGARRDGVERDMTRGNGKMRGRVTGS